MVLVLLANKIMPTHFEIITCDHFATEFHEKFQDMIVQENFNFDSTCDTYGSHGLFTSIYDSCMEKSCICSTEDKYYCVRCMLNL